MDAGGARGRPQAPFYAGNDRTIGQAAILFNLAFPAIKSVLPNITSEENCGICPGADKTLSEEGMRRIEELWTSELAEKLKQPFSNSKVKPTPSPPSEKDLAKGGATGQSPFLVLSFPENPRHPALELLMDN